MRVQVMAGVAAAAIGCHGALAQNPAMDPAAYRLGEIVVTGLRSDRMAGQNTFVISAADIEARGARTLDEAFGPAPSVHVNVGGGGVPRLFMRGLPQRHVPLYLNGIPMNSAADGQFDPRLIPLENIAEIKVVPGTSSVLYGPGTTAGLINIVTRKGSDDLHGYITTEARSGRPIGGDLAWITSGSAGGSFGASDMFVSASVAEDPGFTSADGFRTPNNDARRLNLFANAGHAWENWQAGFSGGYLAGQNGLPFNSLNDPANLFLMPQIFERLDHVAGGFGQGDLSYATDGLSTRLSGYVNQLNTEDNRYDDAMFSSMSNARVQSFHQLFESLVSGGRFAVDYDAGGAGHAASAASVQHDVLKLGGFVRNIPIAGGGGGGGGGAGNAGTFAVRPLDTEAAATTTSLAFEYTASPLSQLHVSLGASTHWFDQGGMGAMRGTQWATALAYDATPELTFRASASRKVRFPTLQQLFDAQRGNPALSAEIGKTVEATASWSPIEGASLVVTGFRTGIGGFIQNDVTTQQFTNKNTLTRGVEISGRVRVSPNVRLQAGYTHLNTTDETTQARVNFRPSDIARLEAEANLTPAWTFHAALSYDTGQVVTARSGPFQQRDLSDRTTIDLRTAYTVANLGLTFWLESRNVLNQSQENAPGFPAPGRSITAGLRYGF